MLNCPAICFSNSFVAHMNDMALVLFPGIKIGSDKYSLPVFRCGGEMTDRFVSDGHVYNVKYVSGDRLLVFDDVTDLLMNFDLLGGALRNPLASLFYTGESFFPAIEEMNNPVFHQQISMMTRSLCRIFKLVNNLRDFSSLTRGTLSLHANEFNVTDWLSAFFERIEPLIASTGRVPELSVGNIVGNLLADQERLEVALLNLIAVSIMAAGEADVIRFQASLNGRNAVFTVSDNGESVFREQFLYQVSHFPERSDAADTEGVGISLSLCRCIAELHGGRLIFSSGERGTACSLIIPLHTPQMEVYCSAPPYSEHLPPELIYFSGNLPAECYRFFF